MARKGKNKRSNRSWSREALIAQILGMLSNSPRQSFNYKQVSKYLGIKDKGQREFIATLLNELKESNQLEEVSTGKYRIKSRAGYVMGKLI